MLPVIISVRLLKEELNKEAGNISLPASSYSCNFTVIKE